MKGLIVTANVAYAAQKTWGSDIAEVHRKIRAKYLYKKVDYADSITVMMTYLTLADEQRNRQEETALEETEKVNMVSTGIERLHKLVQQPLELYASEETGDESAMSATSESESSAERSRYQGRGRRKEKKDKKERKHRQHNRSPSTSTSRSPPIRKIWSRPCRSTSRKPSAKDNNPTNCPFCKEFGGYGIAHAAPKNMPHENCNYNKKMEGIVVGMGVQENQDHI